MRRIEAAAKGALPPPAVLDVDIAPLEPTREFLAECNELGIEFEGADLERLGRFLALLLEANKSFNLTAIRTPPEAWTKHVLDALTLVPLLSDLSSRAMLADVGSGGGLPGVPLAIAMAPLKVTLIEATGKKARFLQTVIDTLELKHAEVINDRAEALARDMGPLREKFDAVTARALGPLAVAAELTVPLAKVGGRVLLIKGQKAEQELAAAERAIALLGAKHSGTLHTPTGRVVVLEKVKATARKYPRAAGEPARRPLTEGD